MEPGGVVSELTGSSPKSLGSRTSCNADRVSKTRVNALIAVQRRDPEGDMDRIPSIVCSRSQQKRAPSPTKTRHGRKQGNGGTHELRRRSTATDFRKPPGRGTRRLFSFLREVRAIKLSGTVEQAKPINAPKRDDDSSQSHRALVPRRVRFDDHHPDFGIFGRVADAGHALASAAAGQLLTPDPERVVFADPSQSVAGGAGLVGHSVSGVRNVFDLSSLRSSCSAACQNSSSRPSGLPACSHKRCARSLISCSVGSDNCTSCFGSTAPPLGVLGAWRRAVQASHRRRRWPAGQASTMCKSSCAPVHAGQDPFSPAKLPLASAIK